MEQDEPSERIRTFSQRVVSVYWVNIEGCINWPQSLWAVVFLMRSMFGAVLAEGRNKHVFLPLGPVRTLFCRGSSNLEVSPRRQTRGRHVRNDRTMIFPSRTNRFLKGCVCILHLLEMLTLIRNIHFAENASAYLRCGHTYKRLCGQRAKDMEWLFNVGEAFFSLFLFLEEPTGFKQGSYYITWSIQYFHP